MSIGRFHLHKCVAPPPPSGWPNLQHENHVWRCFRPDCNEKPEYVCGVFEDAMIEIRTSGRAKGGRVAAMRNNRNSKGHWQ